jgi:hypothetical protein
MKTANGSVLSFAAEVEVVGSTALVRLPEDVSHQLPSRGQVAVHGTVDSQPVNTVIEPDGRRGHWMRLDAGGAAAGRVRAGDTLRIELAVDSEWPEPDVPEDLSSALAEAPASVTELWDQITPMARWEWVRWVNATANPATRQRRVEVSVSKLADGKRRPCCFDLSACTDPSVAKSGKLLAPG